MYPRTIDNGHGERMTFLGVDGDRLLISSAVEPGAGPPMHVHKLQTEVIRVVRGRVGYEIDGSAPVYAGPGDTLTFDPGVVHRFWNAGDDELELTGEVFPADNLEYFLTQIYASVAAHGGRPGAFDGAYLLTRYRSEFDMTSIPEPVRRFVFPIQAFVGRVFGRYGHFSDAPAPVRRPKSATLPGRTSSARSSAG
ncbi:cupin domain-containing protein [Solirubrobacter soli]|uniref:cupin domain-containing protein n=1 Tax=Solirubrobacter soli TaxID=363832 RepID=UPI000A0748AA|nr:cupin domain-containing protein [Solirubrobacter soli]